MTLIEVLVVVVITAVLGMTLLAMLASSRRKSSKIGCPAELKQIAIAYRIWEGDNNDRFPARVSVKQGGAMELAATGNVAAVFQVMSNELSTPKLLICPSDVRRHSATNFTDDFSNNNISYFAGLDADDKYSTSILAGDDNFELHRVAVKPGVLELSTNTPIAWTGERHRFTGCIGLTDGSVRITTDSTLTTTIFEQYELTSGFTNRFRWAIP